MNSAVFSILFCSHVTRNPLCSTPPGIRQGFVFGSLRAQSDLKCRIKPSTHRGQHTTGNGGTLISMRMSGWQAGNSCVRSILFGRCGLDLFCWSGYSPQGFATPFLPQTKYHPRAHLLQRNSVAIKTLTPQLPSPSKTSLVLLSLSFCTLVW